MKEYEISLEVKAIATIKTSAYNRSDAIDAAYHLLANELVQAADASIKLSETEVGKILTAKALEQG